MAGSVVVPGQPSRAWTDSDSALWHTARILATVSRGDLPTERVPTLFALRPGEVALAAAPFQLDSMRALGDGSYSHNTAFAFGTGTLGLALGAATLAASANGNANRRIQAEADAQVVWRPDFGGLLTVTNLGFYLVTPTGTYWWDWGSIDLMQVAGFNIVVLQGRSERGAVTWRIASIWAELVFVLWAQQRHPDHPQLAGGAWLPEHWAPWAAAQGYPLPV